MTEPLPSKAYQELCIEKAEELRRWWEPKFGDWVKTRHGIGMICEVVVGTVLVSHCYKVIYRQGGENYPAKEDMIPLPTQRQLIEMLEERGYEWMLWRRGLMQFYRCEFKKDGKPPIERTEGPDPETALLRCLLAVMEGGQR